MIKNLLKGKPERIYFFISLCCFGALLFLSLLPDPAFVQHIYIPAFSLSIFDVGLFFTLIIFFFFSPLGETFDKRNTSLPIVLGAIAVLSFVLTIEYFIYVCEKFLAISFLIFLANLIFTLACLALAVSLTKKYQSPVVCHYSILACLFASLLLFVVFFIAMVQEFTFAGLMRFLLLPSFYVCFFMGFFIQFKNSVAEK
jgi:hypothetical protein